MTAPALNAIASPALSPPRAACAVLTLARTETFIPMKPAAPDNTAPIRKPIATRSPRVSPSTIKTATPTSGDRAILAVEIGSGTDLHGARDLLHPGRPGVGGQYLAAGKPAIGQGQHATGDYQEVCGRHSESPQK